MKLAQLLSITGGLEIPTKEGENTSFPIPIADFTDSEWEILERWNFTRGERNHGQGLPYSLLATGHTRSPVNSQRLGLQALGDLLKPSNRIPVQRRTECETKRSGPGKKKPWHARIRRLAYWLFAALLALTAIGWVHGRQELRLTRERYRWGQQLRAAEEKRKVAELACRQMHACVVVYAARAQQDQVQARPAVYSRPNGKPHTRS